MKIYTTCAIDIIRQYEKLPELIVVPQIGSWVELKSGFQLKVVGVVHEYSGNVRVELHIGTNENVIELTNRYKNAVLRRQQ